MLTKEVQGAKYPIAEWSKFLEHHGNVHAYAVCDLTAKHPYVANNCVGKSDSVANLKSISSVMCTFRQPVNDEGRVQYSTEH